MQAAQQNELEAMTDMFNKCARAESTHAHGRYARIRAPLSAALS